jgi:murein DD-endopeptidase MepM/ murein hydrolase activator NlpD
MKKLLAVAALTATATATLAAPALASEPDRRLDFMGTTVDYPAAAQAEGLATPTRNYRVSARFGQSGPMWSSGRHTGLDFAAPVGTTIKAAKDGRVVAAEPAGAYGNMIEIAHGDGLRTRYAHLSDIDVRKGDRVARGEHIGDLGNTGNSSGPHLHFEVLQEGDPVDPQRFLNL